VLGHSVCFAVHADGDVVPDQHAGERQAGELAPLVGVEDLRFAVFGQVWLLKTPKRAELLEISAYPPYHCRHDHVSFRPRFAALLPLS